MTAYANQPTTNTAGAGKTHGALAAAASVVASVVAASGDTLGTAQCDVALDDVLVLGVRMADLRPENLEKGSPAWNACAAYTLCQVQPWAASHYEGLAREWAHGANALNEVAAERGRDQ